MTFSEFQCWEPFHFSLRLCAFHPMASGRLVGDWKLCAAEIYLGGLVAGQKSILQAEWIGSREKRHKHSHSFNMLKRHQIPDFPLNQYSRHGVAVGPKLATVFWIISDLSCSEWCWIKFEGVSLLKEQDTRMIDQQFEPSWFHPCRWSWKIMLPWLETSSVAANNHCFMSCATAQRIRWKSSAW